MVFSALKGKVSDESKEDGFVKNRVRDGPDVENVRCMRAVRPCFGH